MATITLHHGTTTGNNVSGAFRVIRLPSGMQTPETVQTSQQDISEPQKLYGVVPASLYEGLIMRNYLSGYRIFHNPDSKTPSYVDTYTNIPLDMNGDPSDPRRHHGQELSYPEDLWVICGCRLREVRAWLYDILHGGDIRNAGVPYLSNYIPSASDLNGDMRTHEGCRFPHCTNRQDSDFDAQIAFLNNETKFTEEISINDTDTLLEIMAEYCHPVHHEDIKRLDDIDEAVTNGYLASGDSVFATPRFKTIDGATRSTGCWVSTKGKVPPNATNVRIRRGSGANGNRIYTRIASETPLNTNNYDNWSADFDTVRMFQWPIVTERFIRAPRPTPENIGAFDKFGAYQTTGSDFTSGKILVRIGVEKTYVGSVNRLDLTLNWGSGGETGILWEESDNQEYLVASGFANTIILESQLNEGAEISLADLVANYENGTTDYTWSYDEPDGTAQTYTQWFETNWNPTSIRNFADLFNNWGRACLDDVAAPDHGYVRVEANASGPLGGVFFYWPKVRPFYS